MITHSVKKKNAFSVKELSSMKTFEFSEVKFKSFFIYISKFEFHAYLLHLPANTQKYYDTSMYKVNMSPLHPN